MIYYHERQYGSEIRFSPDNDSRYESAYTRNVKWNDFADTPAVMVLEGIEFRKIWDIPTRTFAGQKQSVHTEKKLDFTSVTDVHATYHRRVARSSIETVRALSFTDWLSINPLKQYFDGISAVELLLDPEGRTYLAKIVKGKIVLEKLEGSSIVANFKVYRLDELVEAYREDLEKQLNNLQLMADHMAQSSHLINFDAYANSPDRPCRPSEFLEQLMKRR